MILTKDNLLRFIREKKYVTPTTIADSFETTTMIGSAALSELAKDKLVYITHLKVGSSPFYYDPLQKAAITELGDKHLSKYDKEIFEKLKQDQVINDLGLSIQERLAVERIKDFAQLLEIKFGEKTLKFWVWFLRDIKETKSQILEALNLKNNSKENSNHSIPTSSQSVHSSNSQSQNNYNTNVNKNMQSYQNSSNSQISNQTYPEKNYHKDISQNNQNHDIFSSNSSSSQHIKNTTNSQYIEPIVENGENNIEERKLELSIERFMQENYLKVENKNTKANYIEYSASLMINNMKIKFDCRFFKKKVTEADIITFYTSSPKPKIIFIRNAPKKMQKLSERLDNLEVVNL